MFAILWHSDHDGSSRVIGPFASDTSATNYVETDPDLGNSPGVCVLPLDAPAEILPDAGDVDPQCGCLGGVLVMSDGQIQRCDDCGAYPGDDEAIEIVRSLLAERAKQLASSEPPF